MIRYAVATDSPRAHGFVRDPEDKIATFPNAQSAADCAKQQRVRYAWLSFDVVIAPEKDPWEAKQVA